MSCTDLRVNRISARLTYYHSKHVALRGHTQITLINTVKESYVDKKIIRQPMQTTEGFRLSLNYKSELYMHAPKYCGEPNRWQPGRCHSATHQQMSDGRNNQQHVGPQSWNPGLSETFQQSLLTTKKKNQKQPPPPQKKIKYPQLCYIAICSPHTLKSMLCYGFVSLTLTRSYCCSSG